MEKPSFSGISRKNEPTDEEEEAELARIFPSKNSSMISKSNTISIQNHGSAFSQGGPTNRTTARAQPHKLSDGENSDSTVAGQAREKSTGGRTPGPPSRRRPQDEYGTDRQHDTFDSRDPLLPAGSDYKLDQRSSTYETLPVPGQPEHGCGESGGDQPFSFMRFGLTLGSGIGVDVGETIQLVMLAKHT